MSQTRIFDEAVESRQRQLAQQLAPPDIAREQHRENLRQACLLAGYLYLQPEAVLTWCHYWLTCYGNYTLHERDHLGDLVQQLLYEPPQLVVMASENTPLSNAGNHALQSHHLLRFAGGGRCAIPLQYCQESLQLPMLLALSTLSRSEAHCFLNTTTDALDADLRLDAFSYNNVLQYFYEPSFFILTLYRVHLLALLDATRNNATYALTRHLYTVKAVAHQSVDWTRVQEAQSLTPQAFCVLQFELAVLYQTLDTTDLHQCLQQLDTLWREKASLCYAERERRARLLAA